MLFARKNWPKGTIVQMRVILPKSHGGSADGYGWVAPHDVSAAQVLKGITEQLLPKIQKEFLDLE